MLRRVAWSSATELADLLHVLITVLLIPLTWITLLKWDAQSAIAAHDSLSMHFPALRDFIARGSDWTQVLYRPNIFGGVAIHDMGLLYLPFTLFGKLGLGPVAVMNFTWLLFQAFFCVATSRLAIDLVGIFNELPEGELPQIDLPNRITLIFLTAFAPIIAWRFFYGHPNLILGSFLFLYVFALALSVIRKTLTFCFLILSALAFLCMFPSAGQQMLAYSAVFGLPMILAFAWPYRRTFLEKVPALLTLSTVLVLVGALGVGMLRYAGILHLPFAGDIARGFSEHSAVYSFALISFKQLFSSLTWGTRNLAQNVHQLHEYQLTIGPLLLLLLLVPWKKMRAFSITALIVLMVALLFALKVPPISTLFSNHLSPLRGFRCPHRALLILFFLVPSFAWAGFQYRFRNQSLNVQYLAVAGITGLFAFFSPSWAREFLAWGTCATILFVAFSRKQNFIPYMTPAIFFLSFLGVAAFSERRVPFAAKEIVERGYENIAAPLIATYPQLKVPLFRVTTEYAYGGFSKNVPYAIDLSSVDGYWYPTARFLELTGGLEQKTFSPTTQSIRFPPGAPSFEALRQLYNITVAFNPSARPANEQQLGKTAGPAWFSSDIQKLSSIKELASELQKNVASLHEILRKRALINLNDPKVISAAIPEKVSSGCQSASIQSLDSWEGGQRFILSVQTNADCPLTLATNYFSSLKAKVELESGSTLDASTFPIYGALLGVWVPANAKTIQIWAEPYTPVWSYITVFAGILCWGVAAFCFFQARVLLASNTKVAANGIQQAA